MLQTTEKLALAGKMKEAMLNLYGNRLSGIILYGSYARGDFQTTSDIDFLIILDKERLDYAEEISRMTKVIYPMMLDHDIIISFIPSPLKRWKSEKSFFFDRIKKEGIPIWMKESNAS